MPVFKENHPDWSMTLNEEVEIQIASIRATRDAEIEQTQTALRLLSSCFSEQQLDMPVLDFFKEILPDLSMTLNQETGEIELQRKDGNDSVNGAEMEQTRSVLTARSKAACGIEKSKEKIVDIDSADAENDLAAVEYVEDVVRGHHPNNEPAKINRPRTRSQQIPLVENVKVVKRADVPKPKKRVRFDLKKNVVWNTHCPLPPLHLRLPPSATPRGSALKKGISASGDTNFITSRS